MQKSKIVTACFALCIRFLQYWQQLRFPSTYVKLVTMFAIKKQMTGAESVVAEVSNPDVLHIWIRNFHVLFVDDVNVSGHIVLLRLKRTDVHSVVFCSWLLQCRF